MKALLAFLAVVSSAAVHAQLPVHNTSLTLDAKSVSSGGGTAVSHSSGSQPVTVGGARFSAPSSGETRTHESKTRLEVEMRNLGLSPATARLEWYFLAREITQTYSRQGPGSEFVWDSGGKDISVAPRGEDKEVLESSALAQTTAKTSTAPVSGFVNGQYVNTVGSGATYRSGAKPAGWIVRLMDGDQVLRVQGSSSDMELLGQDSARLKQLNQNIPRMQPVPGAFLGR